LIEQLSAAADERALETVFVRSGRFTDKHHGAINIAFAEDKIRLPERKRLVRRHFGFQLFEFVSFAHLILKDNRFGSDVHRRSAKGIAVLPKRDITVSSLQRARVWWGSGC
jgi:hypothetical protein